MIDLNLQLIKGGLKKIQWLYGINAWWKSRHAKNQYSNTVRCYGQRAPAAAFDELLSGRLGMRRAPFTNRAGALNIFYLGTDELQDRSGILQSLKRQGNLSYFTQADGRYGQYIGGTDEQRMAANADRLLALFRDLHARNQTPHLLIAQTFAYVIDPAVFTEIRDTYGTLVVNIAMDDRHQYWGWKINGKWGGACGLIPHVDLVLTAAPECVDWYLKEGCPAMFFPEASDPEIFHPMPDLPKLHDVCFVGRRYGIREKIVLALRQAGIKVAAYGDGWEDGHMEVEGVPRLFAQSRIVLGIGTIGHSTDMYALKMRDFDGPMSGSCYLTHDNPDLSLLFRVGKELQTYRSTSDCVSKARYLLANDREREAIASAGACVAKRDHTWQRRFQQLLTVLEAK